MGDYGNALDFITSQQVQQLQGGGLDTGNNAADTASYLTLPPWIQAPPGFSAFDYPGAIVCPNVGVTAIIFAFTVPEGYDGVIKRLSHNYTGGGFVQGSGDFIWSITIDSRPAKNYNNMVTEYGTTQIARETDGIQIYSGQTIAYQVNHVSNPAFGVGTYLIATLAGYYYPRGQQ